MRLWLDDARPAPGGWALARNYDEAVNLLITGDVVEVSLDYDLDLEVVATTATGLAIATSNRNTRSGYDVARWIEKAVRDGRIPALKMRCHSTNPVGQQLITAVITRMNDHQ